MKKATCDKCKHQWTPRTEKPVTCPKCKTYNWEKKEVK